MPVVVTDGLATALLLRNSLIPHRCVVMWKRLTQKVMGDKEARSQNDLLIRERHTFVATDPAAGKIIRNTVNGYVTNSHSDVSTVSSANAGETCGAVTKSTISSPKFFGQI
jgi:Fe-S cluster assembly iron-binding protein IscA